MGLLQMSIEGSVIILTVIVIRVLLLNRLPKKTFLILWGIAIFRLTIPLSISSEFSVYSFLQSKTQTIKSGEEAVFDRQKASGGQEVIETEDVPEAGNVPDAGDMPEAEDVPEVASTGSTFDRTIFGSMVFGRWALGKIRLVWTKIWLAGFLVCAGFFILSYLKWRREFRFFEAVTHEAAVRWLAAHPLKRRIRIRQSGRILAPLTYGLFAPVILMPENTKWDESQELSYVLEHEFVHIRRMDGGMKFLLTAGLCIHWFNPLVWVMYVLANRDLELSCDEAVVLRFGEDIRACYARTLIRMEERKITLMPLGSNFSKNAIEERITAIMKIKRTSLISILAAGALIMSVIFFLATSAATEPEPDWTTALNGDIAGKSESRQTGTEPAEGRSGSGGRQQKEGEARLRKTYRNEEGEAQRITLQVLAGISVSPQEEGTFSFGGEKNKFFWYTITNDTDKTITGIEYGMLAYDSEGNPLKIYWNAMDSSKTSSYYCTIKDNNILLRPGEAAEHERTIFDVDSFWSLIELKEGEAYRVDMVLYNIRQILFEDGTVWENPEYDDWIENCKGKRIPSSYLWDYYPCEYFID